MTLTAQPTPDLPENSPKENSTQIGEEVDAKGIVDNPANEVGGREKTQSVPLPTQILELLAGCSYSQAKETLETCLFGLGDNFYCKSAPLTHS